MDHKTKLVLTGYLSLDAQQRKEIANIIEGERSKRLDESTIRKDADISMGPSGTGCPCCGR